MEQTVRQQLWRFSPEEILHHARRAKAPESFQAELLAYLDYAKNTPEVQEALAAFYIRLYHSEEVFFPIIQAAELPLPEESEKRFPGMFSTVIYLAAARNLEQYLSQEGLDDKKYHFLDTYYGRLESFMQMNFIRDGTYALLRLGYFLYGYSKPFSLRIGRLIYQLHRHDSLCEVYEKSGQRLFVATPECRFDADGYPAETGRSPVYEEKDGTLTAHIWQNGVLKRKPQLLDMAGWKPLLRRGDTVITIHIPGDGKLTFDTVTASLREATPILRQCFGKFSPKLIVCRSWLLSPQLETFLPEDSNILQFQHCFDAVGWLPDRNALYEHIFKCPLCPPEALIPQNSFQENILNIYRQGKELHSGFGVLKSPWQTL